MCEYTEADKMAYLHEVSQKVRKPTRLYCQQYLNQSHKYKGVTNMEMEALVFAALTNMAGIRYLFLYLFLYFDQYDLDQVFVFVFVFVF